MTPAGPYSRHLDTLIALVTYLALTVRKSRTAPGMAGALSLDEDEVRSTLTTFTGIFRRSANTSDQGEHYFTLHARYALRAVDADEQEALPDMRPEIMKALLDLVSQRALAEAEEARFAQELAHTSRNARIAAWAACTAAVLAAAAAVLAAVVGS